LGSAVLALILVNPAVLAAQQWTPEIKNLKVLPEDTPPRQVVGIMRGFAIGLGVRCTYCHVGEEGAPLSTYDFASDEKLTKRKARVMLGMVQDINGKYLTELPTEHTDHEHAAANRLQVRCGTCHRGQPRPLTLAQALTAVIEGHGADSAVAYYHGLRERFFGSDTYDFTENSLNGLAYQLLGKNRPQDAVAIFRLNVKMYPESANPYDSLADGLKAVGDTAGALESYKKAFAIDPTMRGLQARIDSLAP
jgi:tetratricopeptide (TPR) repeat protein